MLHVILDEKNPADCATDYEATRAIDRVYSEIFFGDRLLPFTFFCNIHERSYLPLTRNFTLCEKLFTQDSVLHNS